MAKIFYNMQQASQRLGLSLREVEAKVSSGELPVVSVGNRTVIPADAVNNMHKKTKSQADVAPKRERPTTPRTNAKGRNSNYYTDVEVAQRLNIPYPEIYRMANRGELPVSFVDERRMFPKQAIDHLAAQTMSARKHTNRVNNSPSRTSNDGKRPTAPRSKQAKRSATSSSSHSSESGYYFTLEQLAHAFKREQRDLDRMVRWGEIAAVTIDGQRWVSREETEKLILRRQGSRQEKIRNRLPKPRLLRIDQEKSSDPTSRDSTPHTKGKVSAESQSVIEVSERMVMEAAQRLGTSINKVRQMITEGELVPDQQSGQLVRGSRDPVNQPSRDATSKQPKTPNPGKAEESPPKPDASRATPSELEERIGALIRETEGLTEELEQEKSWHAKDLHEAQHEIDQSDIQLANLRDEHRKTTEKLDLDIENLELTLERLESELERERERREDAEYSAQNLQRLLEEAPESQGTVGGFLKSFGRNVRGVLDSEEAEDGPAQGNVEELDGKLKQEQEARRQDKLTAQYEYAHLENSHRDLEALNRTLESKLEANSSNRREVVHRIEDLESKLLQSEAERERLEAAFTQERREAHRLAAEVRVLAEVRRLLGADAAESLEQTKDMASVNPPANPADVASRELFINTPYGQWTFRPPFALEEDEIDLIRLVAGEDEITAEQIKRRTGRRRATDDLDELLDRLYEAGVEPITKANDRYGFDPHVTQDQITTEGPHGPEQT